jgi:hypothetical protein
LVRPDHAKLQRLIETTMATTYSYTVEPDTFYVHIYVSTQSAPVIYQPVGPDGNPWPDQASAEAWAAAYVAEQTALLPVEDETDNTNSPSGPEM